MAKMTTSEQNILDRVIKNSNGKILVDGRSLKAAKRLEEKKLVNVYRFYLEAPKNGIQRYVVELI